MTNNPKTTQIIHGVALCINDYGVVITGENGIGKSDLALRLIERGHKFIADDYIKIKDLAAATTNDANLETLTLISKPNDGVLSVHAHAKLGGFIYIRDIGFVDIKATYGDNALITKHKLDLIIELTKNSYAIEPEAVVTENCSKITDDRTKTTTCKNIKTVYNDSRINNHDDSCSNFTHINILGQQVPIIKFNMATHRPLELLVELAVKCSQQLANKYNANYHFIEKQQQMILDTGDTEFAFGDKSCN